MRERENGIERKRERENEREREERERKREETEREQKGKEEERTPEAHKTPSRAASCSNRLRGALCAPLRLINYNEACMLWW